MNKKHTPHREDAIQDAYIAIKTTVANGAFIIQLPAYARKTIKHNEIRAAKQKIKISGPDETITPNDLIEHPDENLERSLYTSEMLEKITRQLTPKQKTMLITYYEEQHHKEVFDRDWRRLRKIFSKPANGGWTEGQVSENAACYQQAMHLLDRLSGYLQNPGDASNADPGAVEKEMNQVREKKRELEAEQLSARPIRLDWWFFVRLKQEGNACTTINSANSQYKKAIKRAREIAN